MSKKKFAEIVLKIPGSDPEKEKDYMKRQYMVL